MARTKKAVPEDGKCPTCHRTLPAKAPPKETVCAECGKEFTVQGRGAINRKTCSAECFLVRTRRQQRKAQGKFRHPAPPPEVPAETPAAVPTPP